MSFWQFADAHPYLTAGLFAWTTLLFAFESSAWANAFARRPK